MLLKIKIKTTTMNESKLWQLRAGLITESEYQESIEEIGAGQNPAPPSAQGAGQKEKLATSAPQLGTDLVKTGQDLKKSSNGLQSSEISRLDSVVAKLVNAARQQNFASTLSQIEAFIDSKLKSFK